MPPRGPAPCPVGAVEAPRHVGMRLGHVDHALLIRSEPAAEAPSLSRGGVSSRETERPPLRTLLARAAARGAAGPARLRLQHRLACRAACAPAMEPATGAQHAQLVFRSGNARAAGFSVIEARELLGNWSRFGGPRIFGLREGAHIPVASVRVHHACACGRPAGT